MEPGCQPEDLADPETPYARIHLSTTQRLGPLPQVPLQHQSSADHRLFRKTGVAAKRQTIQHAEHFDAET